MPAPVPIAGVQRRASIYCAPPRIEYSIMTTTFRMDFAPVRQNVGMGQIKYGRCPRCGARLELVPSPGGGPRKVWCDSCDLPDPMKQVAAFGWLKGELQPPK